MSTVVVDTPGTGRSHYELVVRTEDAPRLARGNTARVIAELRGKPVEKPLTCCQRIGGWMWMILTGPFVLAYGLLAASVVCVCMPCFACEARFCMSDEDKRKNADKVKQHQEQKRLEKERRNKKTKNNFLFGPDGNAAHLYVLHGAPPVTPGDINETPGVSNFNTKLKLTDSHMNARLLVHRVSRVGDAIGGMELHMCPAFILLHFVHVLNTAFRTRFEYRI